MLDSRSLDVSGNDLIPFLEASLSHQDRINRLSLTLHNFNFRVNFWNLLGNMALQVLILQLMIKKGIAKSERRIQDLTFKIQCLTTDSDHQKELLDKVSNSLTETKNILHESTCKHEREIQLQQLTLIQQQKAIKELKGHSSIWNILLRIIGYGYPLVPISLVLILLTRKYKGISSSLIMILLILYFQRKQ